jgi:hypothetical protein
MERRFKPLPGKLARALLDHQRWLSSDGRFGKRLECDPDTQLVDFDLDGMDFSGASLQSAYFKGGSARGARFIGADLAYSTFDSCDVDGADFTRAKLPWARFFTNHEKACFDEATLLHTSWNREEGKRNEALLRKWLMPGGPDRGQSR